MTPEACYSALQLLDRWALTLRSLSGEQLPELPQVQGRRIVAPPIPTPAEDAERIEADLKAAAAWRALADDTEGGNHD